MTPEERRLIPLVSRYGCVDLKALREAVYLSKLPLDHLPSPFAHLENLSEIDRFISIYHQLTDPHGDVVMLTVS